MIFRGFSSTFKAQKPDPSGIDEAGRIKDCPAKSAAGFPPAKFLPSKVLGAL
jgi:hypothetical protein